MTEEDVKNCMIDGIPREIIQKELATYKKALELACDDLYYERCSHCIINGLTYDECDMCNKPYDYIDKYLQKATED